MIRIMFITVLCFSSVVRAGDLAGKADAMRQIPEAQREIAQTLNLLQTTDYGREGEAPLDSYKRVVSELINSGVCTPTQMLLQVVLAYADEEEANGESVKLIQIRSLMGYTLAEMRPEEIITSLAPYYEQAEDVILRRNLEHLFDMATIREGRRNPNFNPCSEFLESRRSAPQQRLVRYMFHVNPDKALPEVQKVYGKAGTQAKSLQVAVRGEWWEEIYAAEKMKKNPKLRDPELIEQLKKSKHAVVRETVQEIEDEKK